MFSLLTTGSDQNRKLAELVRRNGSMLHPYFLSRMLFTKKQRAQLLTSNDDEVEEKADASLQRSLQHTRKFDPVNRVSYLETRCYMLNTLLRDSDAMSMAHGLEIRVPLIDHRLAQMVMNLPGNWKLDQNTPKPLLVSALAGALPKEIVTRKKLGFTLPFEHWLKDELRPEMEKWLSGASAGPLGGVLEGTMIQRVWRDFLEGRTSWSRPWSLYVLDSWCRLHGITV
jgi:asparagine synthase (glutamine-hydrolysing)